MSIGQEKSIFLSALDIDSLSEREAFLSRACGPDGNLRAAVAKLLSAHNQSLNVLDERPVPCDLMREQLDAVAPPVDATPALLTPKPQNVHDRTGESIGHYRLMEKIGEGGFGQVYVAEQQRPVRRRVALKLLKSFMDSKEVIARFEAERQALALMDHPNIARVFDGGTSTSGQPYFVMELVRGVPITEFCEQQRLSIRDRLALFIDVCHAVQHAHQRGVIHRDLKPSNVMVTLHDVTPVVKVIDFGVAKAIGEPLTDKTIYTRFAQMIGTPMYMSPEQAELNSLDVDTRSDVYALGVLLYELLTGTTPYDQKRMQTATFDELRRIIREEEPPRPSTRLSTRAAANESTSAAKRGLLPETVARTLRGELDWVVMKAMEKDRRRRYESAADLARDVQRYLDQQPVVARRPSTWYRLQKFAQRNKVVFTASSLVLLALVTGTAVSTWQAIRATNALATAEKHRKSAEQFADRLKKSNVLLDSGRANADQQQWKAAWRDYTEATELQPDHYLAWSGRGSLGVRVGAWKTAAADFGKALRLDAPANNPGWWGVPQLCAYMGDKKAYDLAHKSLKEQFESSDNPVFLMSSARALLDLPMSPADAKPIAQKLEKQLEQHLRDDRPPHPEGEPRPGDRGPKGKGHFGERRPGPPPKDGPPPEHGGPFGPGLIETIGPGFRMGPPGGPPEIRHFIMGLAHYRAGDYGAAEKELRGLLDRDQPLSRMALPVMAMTEHALGNKELADQYLTQADQFIQEWVTLWATSLDDRIAEWQLPGPWFDLIELLLLQREAHQRIRKATPIADERLDEIEKRALARFQNS